MGTAGKLCGCGKKQTQVKSLHMKEIWVNFARRAGFRQGKTIWDGEGEEGTSADMMRGRKDKNKTMTHKLEE